jgi:D-alanyl-D-alanine carboxypeptidase
MSVEHDLQRVINRVGEEPDIAGLVVRVESEDKTLAWEGSVGELDPERPFFVASTTKLYTTAIVLRLSERGCLNLDDRLVDLVDPDLVSGIHVFRGIDHTDQITVRHLMAQTSGLADYFGGRRRGGKTLEHTLRSGSDVGWTLHDVLGAAREMGPAFLPGAPGRALYSDTNFQLLGRVIEEATGVNFADSLRGEIIDPLGLDHTWLYTDPADDRALPLRDGRHRLDIPKAMASTGPDGGLVATVGDLMGFLRGFFEGRLFDPAIIPQLRRYNRIFFPLQYGIGFVRFRLPRIFSPWAPPPELIGHSGLSGAFAFFAPERRMYLAGTVNNLARPSRPFRLMLRLLQRLRQG